MKTKKKSYKIGDKVYHLNRKLEIEEKEVIAIVKHEKETKYKLDNYTCNGTCEKEIFESKAKAEAVKQKYINSLNYRVGDIVIIENEQYGRKSYDIGRVSELQYDTHPYLITFRGHSCWDSATKNIVKVDENYIENFEDIKELNVKFDEAQKELDKVKDQIDRQFENLCDELERDFKKSYSWGRLTHKPKFDDRFIHHKDEYYD